MAALRFPSDVGVGMPFVHFKSFQYFVPLPDIKMFEKLNERGKGSHPEIAIYMPGDFSENVGATWSLEDIYQGTKGDAAQAMTSNLGGALGKVDGGKALASVQAAIGAMPYPTDVQIFRGVDPINLNFNFNMMPMNKPEADAMMNIARTFKTAILPTAGTFATKSVVLKFPNVWDITFSNVNGMGLESNTYADMCLTNCTVGYSNNTEGMATYNKDKNPIGIKLSLTFVALKKHYLG